MRTGHRDGTAHPADRAGAPPRRGKALRQLGGELHRAAMAGAVEGDRVARLGVDQAATFSSASLTASSASLALDAVGTAALGHVGAAAAALPAQRRDRGLDQVDRADLAGKIVGDSDSDAGAAFVDRDKRADARAEALLHVVNSRAQALGIEAFDDLAEEFVAVDVLRRRHLRTWPLRRPSRAPSSRRRARARAAGAPRPATRCAPALRRARIFSVAAASRSFASRSLSHWRAASPVSASIRRTPEETALSRDDLEQLDVAERADVRAAAQLDRIIAVVERPIESTRTSSPYFSPNSAIAPAEIASSGVISRVVTGSLERICAFTSASTASISSRVSALGCEKSKRK